MRHIVPIQYHYSTNASEVDQNGEWTSTSYKITCLLPKSRLPLFNEETRRAVWRVALGIELGHQEGVTT